MAMTMPAYPGSEGAATGAVQLPEFVGPYLEMYFKQIHHWEAYHVAAFAAIVILGADFLAALAWIPVQLNCLTKLERNPRLHYDTLSSLDWFYIAVNRISVVCFTYHLFRLLTLTPSISWDAEDATFSNCILVLFPMVFVFDFFYSAFHWFLHWKSVYPYIHKHHHKQVTPTRGSLDAFNVHPVEFVVGENCHLLAFYLVPCHIFAVLILMMSGTVLATLNHMDYHACIPGLYDSRDHAVHHARFMYNFGQYTMFWDKLWGWYKSYDDKASKRI
jgi:sterol desaturase/sphingolipid hydroxylase (fatty acid hydroxylase superfamily)